MIGHLALDFSLALYGLGVFLGLLFAFGMWLAEQTSGLGDHKDSRKVARAAIVWPLALLRLVW